MSWYTDHRDWYVKTFGEYPSEKPLGYFSADEMRKIKSAWKAFKRVSERENKYLLLLGRDVWIFKVLAERENFKHFYFSPCVSRQTAPAYKGQFNQNKYILVDTGFVGSIGRAVGVDFALLSFAIPDKTYNSKQIFPYMKGSRELALKIENTPKYWESARIVEGRIVQPLNETEHSRAFRLTSEIWKDSTPMSEP